MKQIDIIKKIKKFGDFDYQVKLLLASKRHSCEVYLPKKWEGSKVLIIKLE